MNQNFLYQTRAILQELFFICCLTRGIWFTPWFPYIKNKILSTPFVFLQGIKKGLLKHPFLVQIYFSTTLIILFIQPLFWEPIFIISIPSWTSRTVRYCLVHCKWMQGFTGKVHSILVKMIGKHYTEGNHNKITG